MRLWPVILKVHLVVYLFAIDSIDKATATAINEIFFEVLIAPSFDEDALQILKSKKNRILLKVKGQNLLPDKQIQK